MWLPCRVFFFFFNFPNPSNLNDQKMALEIKFSVISRSQVGLKASWWSSLVWIGHNCPPHCPSEFQNWVCDRCCRLYSQSSSTVVSHTLLQPGIFIRCAQQSAIKWNMAWKLCKNIDGYFSKGEEGKAYTRKRNFRSFFEV